MRNPLSILFDSYLENASAETFLLVSKVSFERIWCCIKCCGFYCWVDSHM